MEPARLQGLKAEVLAHLEPGVPGAKAAGGCAMTSRGFGAAGPGAAARGSPARPQVSRDRATEAASALCAASPGDARLPSYGWTWAPTLFQGWFSRTVTALQPSQGKFANDGWSPTPTTRQTSAAADLKSLRTDGADVGRAAKVWHRPLGAIVLGNDRKPPRARRSFRSGRAERVSSATSAGGRRRRS